MPQLKITIDGKTVDVYSQGESPVVISYDLEDQQDFQSKAASTSLDVKLPATLNNDQIFNTFRNPDVIDLSPDSRYRKARSARIEAGDVPVLVGKALLKSATSSNLPEDYTANFYGDNGDWMVDMQDLTLYDCLPTQTHVFDLGGIEGSWFHDGYNPVQTWVYAPVRYGQAFSDNDSNIQLIQMRPALFVYWIIQRAFARYGYRISSQFMDSAAFRGLVMPWTWGNFLGINSKLADLLKFRVTGSTPGSGYFTTSQSGTGTSSGAGVIKPGAVGTPFSTGDSFSLSNTTSNGGYDNNANYTFDNTTGMWTWTYKAANGVNFGTITAFFGVSAAGRVGGSSNSNASIFCDVYKNGALVQTQQMFNASSTSPAQVVEDLDLNRVFNFSVSNLVLGNTVSICFRWSQAKSFLGQTENTLWGYNTSSGPVRRTTFELFRIQIQTGGIVDWTNFEQFKKYKFLDFLRGVIDVPDLTIKSDPISKVVVMEPTHPCNVGAIAFSGYFKTQRLDWTAKKDLSQVAEVVSFDDLERDYMFQMKDDTQDGGVQVLGKRYTITPGSGKFRFGSRFKEGKQSFENRFFSPVVHLKMTQWSDLPGGQSITPQIIAIVPESLSDTSSSEAENDFQPKICFYKGYIMGNTTGGVGVFRMNGNNYPGYPYMFAVNYQPGGENDMILTYNDQRIGNVVAPGLLRRFFLQRLAIQDNGVKSRPWMHLNNNDVTNWMHRERIIMGSNQYLLTNIDRWDPLKPLSTQCTFWKFIPVEQKHRNQVYPSAMSVAGTINPVPAPDIAYQQMFILPSDLPTYGS